MRHAVAFSLAAGLMLWLAGVSWAQGEGRPYVAKPGDLLFQDLDGSPLCDAIEKVTAGVDGAKLSHVGMIARVEGGTPMVIEAVSAGVVETPLDDFLARSKDEAGQPKVLVGRLRPEYRNAIPKAIESAKQYLGRPYDSVFKMAEDSFYCSELLYEAFRRAAGTPLFALAPMTFNDPDTRQPFPAWVDHYAKLGMPIPEGEPGLNPGGMSSSPTLDIVHAFGQPAGYEPAATTQDEPMKLTVMTYNIRYDNPNDGEDRWEMGRDRLVESVRTANPDILGTQEALVNQVGDLADALPDYGWVGLDRDADGGGEFMAVFYKRDRFGVVDSGTFWLSETPHVPGTRSWESACNRTATWLHLVEYASGRHFRFYNTHLDHRSEAARREGAALILREMQAGPAELPTILTGDFNAAAAKSEAWKTLCGADGLLDTWLTAEVKEGPEGTFTGFDLEKPAGTERIDWILVSKGIGVESCRILTQPEGERRRSDHRPIVAELRIPAER